MASFKHVKLSENLAYYVKSYETFCSKLAAGGTYPFVRSEDFDHVINALEDQETLLRVLNIGGGTGYPDSEIISQLHKRHPLIHTTVVEPASAHIKQYQALASKDPLSGITWDWREQTWEDYWKSREESGSCKFNVILAIHSLYYVDDLEQSVLDLVSCLKEGGLLVVILVTEDCHYTRLSNSIAGNCFIKANSHILKSILDKHRIQFSEVTCPHDIDVTDCLSKEDEASQHLIDFLSHVVNFRKTAPPDVLSDFTKMTERLATRKGERLMLGASVSTVSCNIDIQ